MSSATRFVADEPDQFRTVPALLERALANRGAEFAAFDFSGTYYTLGDLDRDSRRLAIGLQRLGVSAGDAVGSILDNGWDQVVLLFACSKLGAVHVPVNTAYKGEFLRHQLCDSGAKVLIAGSDEYAQRILAVVDGIPDARVLLCRGELPRIRSSRLALMTLDDAYADDTASEFPAVRCNDDAMLLYTSGTTGPSKGCIITQGYVCNVAKQIARLNRLTTDDVVWTPLPGFHMNMICLTLLSTLRVGARASIYPRFSVSNFWPEIERSRATGASLLSSMLTLLADAPDSDAMKRCFGQLRFVIGVPFPEPLVRRWKDRFGLPGNVTPAGFGLTECSGIASCAIDEPRPPNSSGRENDDFELRIFDDDDNELPPGEPGEIVVRPKRPYVMFSGYWKRPEETLRQMRNGWFHTGDIGRLDEQGFLYFVDRKKDSIRRRGENISSFELENAFRSHGQLLEVAVHAVKSALGEDDVKLTAVLVPGADVTPEALCRWSLDKVPYFAVPRYIEFRAELPKNPVGRVLKYQLRDEGLTSATWDRMTSNVIVEKR